ncbi:hypothetical protein G6F57_022981 [Rhizopus arrhizus]|nr:hypothetical protein G6F57_022981 [Rhizopus arrhizus]
MCCAHQRPAGGSVSPAGRHRHPLWHAERFGAGGAAAGRAQPSRRVRIARLSGAPWRAAGARRFAPPQLPVVRAGRNLA